VHCFALMPVHFDQVHSVFEAGTDSHERAAIGEMLRLGLREALSSFPAPLQANVLAFTTMLCLLRQIESSLLMSAFCTLLRFGNDAACRFFLLARLALLPNSMTLLQVVGAGAGA
jgi:hypothetical protein